MEKEIIISAEKISRSYEDKHIFTGLDLSVLKNDKILLTGDNGSGKTTLLKLLAAQLTSENGKILYNGKQLNFKNIKNIVSFLPSDPPPLFPRMTGLENLKLYHSLSIKNLTHKNKTLEIQHFKKLLNNWCDHLDIFKDSIEIPSYKCSMGMKQIISIFRALSRNCSIYILDEPFQSLSQETITFVLSSLELHFKDKVFIISSHQKIDETFFNRTLKLKDGELCV